MKKLLASVLALALTIPLGLPVLASSEALAEEPAGGAAVIFTGGITPFEIKEETLEQQELVQTGIETGSPTVPSTVDETHKNGEYQTESFTRSPVSVTQSFNATLGATGDWTYTPATLAPNQILHATLACPENPALDWDLFIVELDAATGGLGNVVASSTFATLMNTYEDGSIRTIDEACSVINRTGTDQTYAIIIQVTTGGATANGILTISLDLEAYADPAEPNDHPGSAYVLNNNTTVSGANLNVSNDVDWYLLDSRNGEITSFSLNINHADADVQVYSYTNGGMKLVGHNQPSYDIDGLAYVRIAHKFPLVPLATILDYTIDTRVTSGVAAYIEIELDGDMSGAYVDYGRGRAFRTKNALNVTIAVYTAGGLRCPNTDVELLFENQTWLNNHNTALGRKTFSTTTGGDGTVYEEWTIPTSSQKYQYIVGPVGNYISVHYYDISALTFTAGDAKLVYEFYHVFRTDLLS